MQVTLQSFQGAVGAVAGISAPSQANIDCGSTCAGNYAAGTTVTLTASPATGYRFAGWAGDCAGSAAQCVVTMSANRAVTAKFSKANVIFATSAVFTIPSLAAKGGGTGAAAMLAGADLACAEAVSSPGSLAPPGRYVAWISSSQISAVDRLRTAAGGSMPRGWVRIDGRPFVDQLLPDSTVTYWADIRYPVGLTEKGTNAGVWVFTGTDRLGVAIPTLNCSDWTSSASSATVGVGLPTAGGGYWTEGVGTWCSTPLGVYCMQVDSAAPLAPLSFPAGGKRAFVSNRFAPTSGLDAADAKCRADATTAGLPGTFRALLATTTASAASRFHVDGLRPFVRPDGVVVTDKDSDLFTAPLKMLAPISVNAAGHPADAVIYSGASNATAVGDLTCGNWTIATAASTARYGIAHYPGINYFGVGFVDDCTRGQAIYCLED